MTHNPHLGLQSRWQTVFASTVVVRINVRADSVVRSLLRLSVGRRSLLRNGVKLGTLSSLSAAAAACAPAFPRLAQPVVLPTGPGVGVDIHSMSHASPMAP